MTKKRERLLARYREALVDADGVFSVILAVPPTAALAELDSEELIDLALSSATKRIQEQAHAAQLKQKVANIMKGTANV